MWITTTSCCCTSSHRRLVLSVLVLVLALLQASSVFVDSFLPPLTASASRKNSRSRSMSSKANTASRTTDTDTTNLTEATSDTSTIVDRSTLTLLEHVNLNIPSLQPSLDFYFTLLGCGMDPRKAGNLNNPETSPKKTAWANCGASQFHLPHGETAQVIPGKLGLRYESLDGLQQRLTRVKPGVVQCSDVRVGLNAHGQESLQLVDSYGNVFVCRASSSSEKGNNVNPGISSEDSPPPLVVPPLQQPFIKPTETDQWGWIAEQYGCERTDCRGIDFVEFLCPIGTADKIALFYETVLDATTSVVIEQHKTTNEDDNNNNDATSTKIAMIAVGNVDASGRADQALLFRETSQSIPKYDGHHVAMYLGESAADFERAFSNCDLVNVVWVNPRFSDKASNLQGAKQWKQFRFKNIVDMKTGETIFELEHEMRSIEHEAWPGRR